MKIQLTEHPVWAENFLKELEPYEKNIVDGDCFEEMAAGTLDIDTFRGIMVSFIPLIENFPKYMALILPKVPPGDTFRNNMARSWLIQNLNIERLHAAWYRNWIWAFGVSRSIMESEVHLSPEINVVNNYLWQVCTYGTLPEAIAALNYAIEGPTGIWTQRVFENIKRYEKYEGVQITRKSLAWLKAHALYDDLHPEEALEIIKAFATTPDEQEKALRAAKNGMAYYAMSAQASYDKYNKPAYETYLNHNLNTNWQIADFVSGHIKNSM